SHEVEVEIDRLEAKRSIDLGGDFEIRNRQGYGGFAGMTDLRVPLRATIPIGFRDRFQLEVAPTLIDASPVNGADPNIRQRFGALGLDPMRPLDGQVA